MAGTERRPAWFRREPYPSVVSVLLDHELLAEGGTASLRLAARIVESHDLQPTGRSPVDAVATAIVDEHLADHLADDGVVEAAQAIVDVLVEHRAPADPS